MSLFRNHWIVQLLATLLLGCAVGIRGKTFPGEREEKLLSLFGVIKFQNSNCSLGNGNTGVCFTAQECTDQGGTPGGSCAAGYGICCSFDLGCGGMSNTVFSYFVSSENDASPCLFRVCKCSPDICQYRLDFDAFNIAQPEPAYVIDDDSGDENAEQPTQCQDAQFSATSEGNTVPVICGTNQGEHIYLEAEEGCNTLMFTFGGGDNVRDWRIRIEQLSITNREKAPEGCLQFYTGAEGTVSSFNFQGGIHLADQNYWACIRQEPGLCSIEWSSAPDEFMVSAFPPMNLANDFQRRGELLTNFIGDACMRDYVLIPFGRGQRPKDNADRFCGPFLARLSSSNDADVAPLHAEGTVRSQMPPFMIGFVTDSSEQTDFNRTPNDDTDDTEAKVLERIIGPDALSLGFRLNYKQTDECRF